MKPQDLPVCFNDKVWRMNNLYYIQDKKFKRILFKPTYIQRYVMEHRTGRDIILKARQQMLSTYCIIDFLDDCLFTDNINAVTIADQEKNLPGLFRKASYAYNNLIPTLKKLYPLKIGTKYEMYIANRDSHYKTALQTHSSTISHMHFSEVAFMENAEDKIAESTESVPLDLKNTKIIFESIANGVGNKFHKTYNSAKSGSSLYKAFFFQWWLQEGYTFNLSKEEEGDVIKSLSGEEKELIGSFNLSPGQIAWRRYKLKDMHNDLATFKVKYPENDVDCFLGSGNNVFDSHLIETMRKDETSHLESVKRYRISLIGEMTEDEDGILEVFEEPSVEDKYTIGIDTSRGLAQDDASVMYVFSMSKFIPVAKVKVRIAPELLALYSVFVGRYYNEALLAPENNDRGRTTAYKIGKSGYRNIYYMGMENNGRLIEWGFSSNVKTKKLIIDQLAGELRMNQYAQLPDSLLFEMSTYIQDAHGSYNAQDGYHDDEVMAFAIGLHMCWMFPYHINPLRAEKIKLDYSKNLQSNDEIGYTNKKKKRLSKNELSNIMV